MEPVDVFPVVHMFVPRGSAIFYEFLSAINTSSRYIRGIGPGQRSPSFHDDYFPIEPASACWGKLANTVSVVDENQIDKRYFTAEPPSKVGADGHRL